MTKSARSSSLSLLATLGVLFFSVPVFAAETHEFDVQAVQINQAKYWLPTEMSQKKGAEFSLKNGATFTVKKGDTVIFHPISKIEGPNNIHGFAIDEFKVAAVVDDKGLVKSKEKEIKFVADKAGEFKIRCQLHPAHIGGMLTVTD
jgi:plastocyanin